MPDPASGRSMADAYRQQLRVVLLVAALSGLGAAFAPGAPTGNPVVDACWRFAWGALPVFAASFAHRWAWILAAGVAAAAAVGGSPWLIGLAMATLVLAIVVSYRRRRLPLAGAILLGLVMQVLVRLPDIGFSGATALIATVAVLPVLISAYRSVGTQRQRRIRRIVLVAGAFVVVALIPVAWAALVTWHSGGRATRESDQWLAAARAGDQQGALSHLAAARSAFADAQNATTSWLVRPARALPLVAPQLSAAEVVSSNGVAIVDVADQAARIAAIQQLRLTGGRIDVALLAQLRDPMHNAVSVMETSRARVASVDDTWLLPTVRSRLTDFEGQLDNAASEADLAAAALDVLPGLLGADGPRHYIVLFTSPSETREQGGFTANWAELTATDGKVELTTSGRATEIGLPFTDAPADASSYPERYLRYTPWHFWQNMTGTPDTPTIARMTANAYQRTTGTAVDGVLTVDPYGLAALLQLTGPIAVDGLDQPLDATNAADFLLRDQYVQFPDRNERSDFLERVSRTTFDQLTARNLPGPKTIGDALGPAVAAGQLQFWSFDPASQSLLARLGMDGAMDVAPGDDAVLVTVANANPNKIDTYLHRTIRYDTTVDPATGVVEGTVTVELSNDAPLDLSDYVVGNLNGDPVGSDRTYLSLYTPLTVSGATLDGQPMSLEAHQEYGLNRAGSMVTIPPDGKLTIVFQVFGQVSVDDGYHLDVISPALANADRVEIAVGTPDGQKPGIEASGPAIASVQADPGSLGFDLRGRAMVVVGDL